MGNRISMSLYQKTSFNTMDESPVLFSHWRGIELLEAFDAYFTELKREIAKDKNLQTGPLGRLEPTRVMIDFIRHLTKDMKRVDSDLYICSAVGDGDNSDNGHFNIDVNNFNLSDIVRD